MKEQLSDVSNDILESDKYFIKFYLGSVDPIELERAKQEALNDIENYERN